MATRRGNITRALLCLLVLSAGCTGLRDEDDRARGRDGGPDDGGRNRLVIGDHDGSAAIGSRAGQGGADAGPAQDAGQGGMGGSTNEAGNGEQAGRGSAGASGHDGSTATAGTDAEAGTGGSDDSGASGNDGEPDAMTPLDACALELDDCDDDPNACSATSDSFMCACPAGYTGDGHGSAGCTDVDECNDDDALCDPGSCENTAGSFVCGCPDGYRGSGTTSCTDVDECEVGAVEACGQGAIGCQNQDGGWYCECGEGYASLGTECVVDEPPPCIGGGDDVVFVGDSYLHYINSLAPRIEALAVADGALAPSAHYRDYAVAGASMVDGEIFAQWNTAKATATKYVVMDGGLIDMLIDNPQCTSDQTDCGNLAGEIDGVVKTMWSDMEAEGVSDVLVVLYPHMPIGGDDNLDYLAEMVIGGCEWYAGPDFHCHVLDARPLFEGHDDWFDADDIHPTAQGADALAAAIWDEMKLQCMAQSSGCCM